MELYKISDVIPNREVRYAMYNRLWYKGYHAGFKRKHKFNYISLEDLRNLYNYLIENPPRSYYNDTGLRQATENIKNFLDSLADC